MSIKYSLKVTYIMDQDLSGLFLDKREYVQFYTYYDRNYLISTKGVLVKKKQKERNKTMIEQVMHAMKE